MNRPLVVDLFCGAGGATAGYLRAGFQVVGVDLSPQPDYCGDLFVQMDALEFMRTAKLTNIVAIFASPPCQASTLLTKGTNKGREYPQLIPQTREALQATGLPYVIENVQGADLHNPVTLCGEMFGLGVLRHRLFETNWDLKQPDHKPHRGKVRGWRHGVYQDGPYLAVYGEGGGKGTVAEWQQAMGIDWTDDRKAIAEAIPPAYTEYIGKQLIDTLAVAA
jgi:DNA (cytosine-5)-methyltransferase 1